MNPRSHVNPYMSNSLAIRQEIQRFESVHPSIYAIYDLIEAIPDMLIQQQIREHVVCIEDSFVNSQEWTLSRIVPDLKLGILGTVNSGKSALVHRYLTGSYMQEESPEGGRFKKEVVLDAQSYLLLIRDEGGLPEMQFTQWVDAVVFVFSLENETSFNAIYSYYAKMAHFHTSMQDIPVILVGTQDAISESNPRLIDDTRARKLASDLRRCSYYETCATYGLNVERVFQDACQKIVQSRLAAMGLASGIRSNTQSSSMIPRSYHIVQQQQSGGGGGGSGSGSGSKSYDTHSHSSSGSGSAIPLTPTGVTANTHNVSGPSPSFQEGMSQRDKENREYRPERRQREFHRGDRDVDRPQQQTQVEDGRYRGHRVAIPTVPDHGMGQQMAPPSFADLAPPPPPVPQHEAQQRGDDDKKAKNGEVGSGRAIPIKQGILYKKSSKPLSKE